MKKSIKILVAFILASSFWSIAHGQSASISANATVINEIAVARVADLNFGTLVAGQIKSIDMMGNVSISSGTALGSTTRGEFTVSASAGSDVRLSFDLPNNLTGSGSDVLPISFSWMDEMGYPEYSVFILEQDGNGGHFLIPPPVLTPLQEIVSQLLKPSLELIRLGFLLEVRWMRPMCLLVLIMVPLL